MSLQLQINSVYTFNTRAAALLGSVIKNAKLESSCNFAQAQERQDVLTQYRAIYPVLPPGSPQDPKTVIYHRFKMENGESVFIAEPWIDSASLVTVTGLNCTVTLVNINSQDRANVVASLAHLGVNFSIQDN